MSQVQQVNYRARQSQQSNRFHIVSYVAERVGNEIHTRIDHCILNQ